MKRRRFLSAAALAGLAGTVPGGLADAYGRRGKDVTAEGAEGAEGPKASDSPGGSEGSGQQFHRDYISYREGLEYYVLGNGRIQAVLQSAATPEAGTHCGIFLMSPAHFSRKASTLLYHPERGVENTRLFVTVDGTTFIPEFAGSRIAWTYPEGVPTLRVEWRAGQVDVVEQFTTPIGSAALVRSVFLRNAGPSAVLLSARGFLYPNLMLFDEYHVDRAAHILTAQGFATLTLSSPEASAAGDRSLEFTFGAVPPGGERAVTLTLACDAGLEAPSAMAAAPRSKSAAYWQHCTDLDPGHGGLAHLFNASKAALRAAVAWNGKMDGGIWQYNLEWVRDQSMVAIGATMCGMTDRARDDVAPALLARMLTRSIDAQGGTVDSSRTRTPDMMELDQNGALLHAVWTYWVWTGDDEFVRAHLDTLARIGQYLLRSDITDRDSGLLKNSREYWERDARHGVLEGFESSYQLWSIVGLGALADMQEHVALDTDSARRLRDKAKAMQAAFLSHPRHALVENGMLIKRRKPDGTVQRLMEPSNRASMPKGMPLAEERESFCDPDTSCVLPIIHGIVDAQGPVARNTLDAMETLWNQRWKDGGYGRYHVTSEPDSPGPWPFPSLFVARANLEAGRHDRVWKVLRWLLDVQGGKGGAWWECYAVRPTPPLPPLGLVVWTWAEIVALFVHHLFGVRPQPRELVLAPHLLEGLDGIRGDFPIRGTRYSITLRRTADEPHAVVDGKRIPAENGIFRFPYSSTDSSIECHVR